MKYCLQKAIENRKDAKDSDSLPVFFFADECQHFTIANDYLFQTTARGSKVCTVYATQNIGNLQDKYGTERTSSLLGNLQTKIFCQNGDIETNKWASESIAKSLVNRSSYNSGSGQNISSMDISNSKNTGFSVQQTIDYAVQPMEFTSLRKGGTSNGEVETIIWQSGKVFKDGKTYLRTIFKQGGE